MGDHSPAAGADDPGDSEMVDVTDSAQRPTLCLPRKRTPEEVEELKKSYLSLLSREELELLLLNKDKDPTTSVFPDDIVGVVATLQSRQGKLGNQALTSPKPSTPVVTSDALPDPPSTPPRQTPTPRPHLLSPETAPAGASDPVPPAEGPPLTPTNATTGSSSTQPPPELPIYPTHPSTLQPPDSPAPNALQVPYLYPHSYHPAPPHPSSFPQPQLTNQFMHPPSEPFPPPSLHAQPQTAMQVATGSKGRGSSNMGNGMPSYEEMLVMAIAELRDPEGSTPKSLFEWMIARFPLMNNFRPSAHQALQKAFKRGRLERVGTKYKLNPNWEGGNTSRRTTRRPQVGNGVPAVTPLPTRLPGFPWPLPVIATGGTHNEQVLSAPPPHSQILAHAYLHPPPGTVSHPPQAAHQSSADESMSLDFLNNAQTSATASPSADALLKAIGAINGLVENAKDEDESETAGQDDEAGDDKADSSEVNGGAVDSGDGDVDGSDIEEDDENDVLLSATLQSLAEQMRILAAAAVSVTSEEPTPSPMIDKMVSLV